MRSNPLLKSLLLLCLATFHTAAWSQSNMTDKEPAMPAAENTVPRSQVYGSGATYWESVLKQQPANQEAWLQLYRARRYENYTAHSRTITPKSQEQLSDIEKQIGINAPNSYAFHYAAYFNNGHSEKAIGHLRSAYALRPTDTELWDDMVMLALSEGNTGSAEQLLREMSRQQLFTAAEMEYALNTLNSVERGGVLVTYGLLDTQPVLIQQQVFGQRRDVRVICLDWTDHPGYAARAGNGRWKAGDEKSVVRSILAEENAVYLSLTLPPQLIGAHENQLWCTGLAMRYSKPAVANLESLAYNWENLFRTEQIEQGSPILVNYLLPMVQLHQYYQQTGQAEKRDQLAARIRSLAARTNQTSTVEKLLR